MQINKKVKLQTFQTSLCKLLQKCIGYIKTTEFLNNGYLVEVIVVEQPLVLNVTILI